MLQAMAKEERRWDGAQAACKLPAIAVLLSTSAKIGRCLGSLQDAGDWTVPATYTPKTETEIETEFETETETL